MTRAWLIAEAGATKTNWALVNEGVTRTFTTQGINPNYLEDTALFHRLSEVSSNLKETPNEIRFLGAGISNAHQELRVKSALQTMWPEANIEVGHDMLGAAMALCGTTPGIACILGTGTNACAFDGKKITHKVMAPGYILGDEGAGSWLGKHLLADFLRQRIPDLLAQSLAQKGLDEKTILEQVYQKPEPGKWMAQFATDLHQARETAYVQTLLHKGFTAFVQNYLLPIPHSSALPIHFTGSVACGFKEELIAILQSFQLQPGYFLKDPLMPLVTYFTHPTHAR
jgi:glucosamine kinase